MSTFVAVGNAHNPFSRFLEAVEAHAARLPKPIVVQSGHTPFRSERCVVVPFMEVAEFERQVASATVVLQHAGGGGVLLAVKAGKVPILMPRLFKHGEHVDDHQVSNARELSESGKVLVIHSAAELPAAIDEAIRRQLLPRKAQVEPKMVGMIRNVLERHARTK